MRLMQRWPRLCTVLTAVAMNDLMAMGKDLASWTGTPIIDAQAGPLIVDNWKCFRREYLRKFIRHALSLRHGVLKALHEDKHFHWAHACAWVAVARRAFAPFEGILEAIERDRRAGIGVPSSDGPLTDIGSLN